MTSEPPALPETPSDASPSSVIQAFLKCPWLTVEFLLFAVLSLALLGYRDMDDKMQLLCRGYFVYCIWIFLVAGLHMTWIVRNNWERISTERLTTIFGIKTLLTIAYSWWCISHIL